jgi:hypothetical protein
MTSARRVAGFTLAACWLSRSPAGAQESPSASEPPAKEAATNETEGQRLFREGREALARSELEFACNKFTESYAKEKAIGPLLNLANCEENRGHLVAARTLWLSARSLPTKDQELAQLAETRLAALEPNVPRLRIELEPGSAPEARVEVDGVLIAQLQEPIYLDPGKHTIAGRAGASEAIKEVTLSRGELLTVKLLVEPPPGPRSEEAWVAGWILGGVGVAGAIGFAVTGAIVLGHAADWADAGCNARETPACAAFLPEDSLYVANAVLGGVGLVAAGVGVVLVALNVPDSDEGSAPVAIGTGPGDLGLSIMVRR